MDLLPDTLRQRQENQEGCTCVSLLNRSEVTTSANVCAEEIKTIQESSFVLNIYSRIQDSECAKLPKTFGAVSPHFDTQNTMKFYFF